MELGVVFPQTEIGTDATAIRDYAQAADDLGFQYMIAYDHVLGADPNRHQLNGGAYTYETQFHEPFALFSYLAGLTSRIRFVTGVIILPQRQTALVAKQAAEVDVLSGGRLVLGVGTGWNQVEYESLGQEFRSRGRRLEEQVALLRALWAQPLVAFEGRFHRVMHAGINPRPVRGAIPIWFGGWADVVMDRVGRMGDGWLLGGPAKRENLEHRRERIHAAARAAGRDPSSIAIAAGVNARGYSAEQQLERARLLESVGATHCSVNTMDAGFTSVAQHIEAIRAFRRAFD